MKIVYLLLPVCVSGACVSSESPTEESADSSSTTEEAVAALRRVESRLALGAPLVQRSVASGSLTEHPLTATMPATVDQPVQLQLGDQKRGLSVVGGSHASKAITFNDNTQLYPRTAPGVSTAITLAAQDTTTVLETVTIIHGPSSPEVYRFDLQLAQGETLTATGEHSAAIVSSEGLVIASIEAPWASDAAGRSVPLALAVDGAQLVMSVGHHNGEFVYPIVADPVVNFTCGLFGCDVYVSRSATRSLKVPGNVQFLLGLICAVLPVAALKPTCAVVALSTARVSAEARECASKNQCLKFHVPGGVATLACRGNSPCLN